MATIRHRIPPDLSTCAAVLRRVYAASGYPVQGVGDPTSLLTDPYPDRAWVAEYESAVVGHVAARRFSRDGAEVAELYKLFVDPGFEGKGLGRLLVEVVVAWARVEELELELFVLEKDVRAMRLYERLGWERRAERMYHYGSGRESRAFDYFFRVRGGEKEV
ncbi:MAG: hypothetical protein MMC23_000007 [Stictis urceolatum]|nr:hypothetical protein [Stictis urceolata]